MTRREAYCVTVKAPSLPNRHQEQGARIKRMRLTTGLSQERFAPLVGITRRHMIRLENGEHSPTREVAARIERVVEEHTGKPSQERVLDDDEQGSDPMVDLARALVRVVRAEIATTRTPAVTL